MPLRFLLLGPLEVWDDGRELPLGAGRQRALLALLLLHANEPVSVERLAEALWEGKPPLTAQKVVQGYVSQLRRALPDGVIITRGSSYELRARDTDAAEFERLVARAASEDPSTAAKTLRTALGLWRGRPLVDFDYESWAQAEAARLEELRLVALENKLATDVQLGQGAGIVPELESLVSAHPLRERPRSLLMLALYRSGRQADALAVYTDGRRRLVDELGIEPGPDLQKLQRQILAQDPSLGRASGTRPLVTARRGRLLVVVGAVLVAAALTALAVELTRGGSAPAVAGNSLALVDPAGHSAAALVAFAAPQSSIAEGDGLVWTLDGDAGTVTAIDQKSKKVLGTFSVGQRPVDIVYGGGSFWILTAGFQPAPDESSRSIAPAVTRYDPRSHTQTASVRLPQPPPGVGFFYFKHRPGQHQLAYGAGSLWVANASSLDSSIYRIAGQGRARIVANVTTVDAGTIVFARNYLWSETLDRGPAEIDQIRPATNVVVRRIHTPAIGLSSFAVGGGSVWVPDFYTGTVWRIIPGTPQVIRAVPTRVGVTSIVVSNGAVWAGNGVSDTLSRIDLHTGLVTATLHVPAPQALAPSALGPLVASGPVPLGSALPPPACGPVQYAGRGVPRFLIASDLDFRADPAANVAMANAVLTVLHAKHFRAGRYSVGYQSCDDSSGLAGVFDPGKCDTNASLYAKTTRVIGVVGTYDSACSGEEIPILETARGGPVALVSPSNTYDVLTRATPGVLPHLAALYPSGVRNFFRVVAPDAIEVAADAELAKQLGLHRVAIVDDGDGGATPSHIAWFRYAAHRLGMSTVVLRPTDTVAALARLRSSHAGGVFIAKTFPFDPGALIQGLRRAFGRRFPIIGTDYLAPVDPAADGVYVSVFGVPNSHLPAAGRRFLRSLAHPAPSLSAAYAGEAATLLLAAVARSDGTRADVVRELHRTNERNGILGALRFGRNGDPVTTAVTILRGVAHGGLKEFPYENAVVDRVISPPPATIHP
ncbi:MAG: hypothetical protein QOE43_238 [Gaiellaceae bacterium]|nr:hypothetical protein [Gaiellaceae bacterium]